MYAPAKAVVGAGIFVFALFSRFWAAYSFVSSGIYNIRRISVSRPSPVTSRKPACRPCPSSGCWPSRRHPGHFLSGREFKLRKFGADIYTIDLTVISLLREMGVLVTAIMVAGRSGSAFAAEIGVMKMRGEVDALTTMGIDPLEALVVPRLLALVSDFTCARVLRRCRRPARRRFHVCRSQLHISLPQYISRVQGIATWEMLFVGIYQRSGLVFALLITGICAYQGMSAKGSAENVGKLTTLAVVQSIFLVIMADAVFSIIFSQLDI